MKFSDTSEDGQVSGLDSAFCIGTYTASPPIEKNHDEIPYFSMISSNSNKFEQLSIPTNLLCKDVPMLSRSKQIHKIETDSKKEAKKQKNRVWAQQSRDRKKRELEESLSENTKLREENLSLKNELADAKNEIEKLKKLINSYGRIEPKNAIETTQKIEKIKPKSESKQKVTKKSKNFFRFIPFKCPLFLTTIFLGCLCFAAFLGGFWGRTFMLPIFMQPKNDYQEKLIFYSAFYNSIKRPAISYDLPIHEDSMLNCEKENNWNFDTSQNNEPFFKNEENLFDVQSPSHFQYFDSKYDEYLKYEMSGNNMEITELTPRVHNDNYLIE